MDGGALAMKIRGVVTEGRRIGRRLGFPTANIPVERNIGLRDGVYAASMEVDGRTYDAMAYIGYRPSIDTGEQKRMLEVNVFRFDEDIYGKEIGVELLEFIRSEVKFSSENELKNAVDEDRRRITEYFKTK